MDLKLDNHEAAEDKSRLLMELGNLYIDGILSKHDIEKIAGKKHRQKNGCAGKNSPKKRGRGSSLQKKKSKFRSRTRVE